jgi:Uncharacterized protein conserved in bacteria
MEEDIGIKNKGFLQYAKETLEISKVDIHNYSPVVLAYMGDAVYELIIRSKITAVGNMQVKKMHRQSSELVKAATQAKMAELISVVLTDEENAVYKRGRNAKSSTMAKNASMIDYRMATGFEALVGYLYLTEQFERLIELVSFGLKKMGEN